MLLLMEWRTRERATVSSQNSLKFASKFLVSCMKVWRERHIVRQIVARPAHDAAIDSGSILIPKRMKINQRREITETFLPELVFPEPLWVAKWTLKILRYLHSIMGNPRDRWLGVCRRFACSLRPHDPYEKKGRLQALSRKEGMFLLIKSSYLLEMVTSYLYANAIQMNVLFLDLLSAR